MEVVLLGYVRVWRKTELKANATEFDFQTRSVRIVTLLNPLGHGNNEIQLLSANYET